MGVQVGSRWGDLEQTRVKFGVEGWGLAGTEQGGESGVEERLVCGVMFRDTEAQERGAVNSRPAENLPVPWK